LRILALVTDAFGGHGGIALYNRDFLTGLCEMNESSEVVALPRLMPNPPEPLPDKLTWNLDGLGGKPHYFRALLALLAHDRKFDLVVCGHINLLPAAWLAKKVTGAQLLLEIYGIDAWRPTKSWLANRLVHQCQAVTSISSVTRDRFLEWAKVDQGKMHLLPNAIHPDWYGLGPKPDYLINRYRLLGKKVLMTLGRLVEKERYKGFDEVLEILTELPKDVSYLIVGDGSDRARLEVKVQQLGVADRVVFAGLIPESEKADHYRLADLYVMPSRGEGFGFVFLEALACGIPCIGSTEDGSREALREGALGQLIDPGEPETLRRAILDGLQQGRGKVPDGLAYFSFANFTLRLETIIRTVLEEGSKRWSKTFLL